MDQNIMDFVKEYSVLDGYMGLGHSFEIDIVCMVDAYLSNFIRDLAQ